MIKSEYVYSPAVHTLPDTQYRQQKMAKKAAEKKKGVSREQRKMRTQQIVMAVLGIILVITMIITLVITI